MTNPTGDALKANDEAKAAEDLVNALDTMDKLDALQASAQPYPHDAIDAHLLDRFANPVPSNQSNMRMWEHIAVPEFTCLCPVTGQPDFGLIEIYYAPSEWCVESKSIKLYMGSYRNVGMFHEAVCHRVCADLCYILAPRWLVVVGRFNPRGGIPFHPRVWAGQAPLDLVFNIQRQHT